MRLFKSTLILISLFLVNTTGMNAQSLINTDTADFLNNRTINKKVSLLSPSRMSMKLDLGVGFIGGSNSGMYTYVAPYLRYSLTPKFKLDVGGILSQGKNNNYSSESGFYNKTSMLLFARGNYLLTEKITVSGSAYKTFYPNSDLNSDLTKKYSDENYGFSLGMNYKINKKMSLGAQIIMTKGNYNNNLFHSQHSMFSSFPYDNFQSGLFGW